MFVPVFIKATAGLTCHYMSGQNMHRQKDTDALFVMTTLSTASCTSFWLIYERTYLCHTLLSYLRLRQQAMLADPVEGEDEKSESGLSSAESVANVQNAIEVLQDSVLDGNGKRGKKVSKKTQRKKNKLEEKKPTEAPAAGSAASTASPSAQPASAEANLPKPAAEVDIDNKETAGAAKPKAGQGKKGAGKGERSMKVKGDQAKLWILVLKQLLQVVQGTQELQSILFDVWVLPTECDLSAALIKQGKRYQLTVSKKGHGLGPPFLYVFGTLLEWVARQGNEVKDIYSTYASLDLSQRNELIRLCRLSKMYNQETRKLVITFGVGHEAQQLRALVNPVLKKIPECTLKIGKPPQGYMQRELGAWLQHLMD